MEYGAEITIKKHNNYYWDAEINSSINRHIKKKEYTYTHMCFYILGGYCKYLHILIWLVHLK